MGDVTIDDDTLNGLLDENAHLRQEVLAQEILLAAMVWKAGGTLTLAKSDLDAISALCGSPQEIWANKAFSHKLIESDVVLTIKPRENGRMS